MSALIQDAERARQWRYFLLLERELERALEVVEPVPENFGTYGLDLARQLVSVCAQFEVVAKLWCRERASGSRFDNIDQIYSALQTVAPRFEQAYATVLWRGERLWPFQDWRKGTPPKWWTAYNKVKHDPALQVPSATLGHVLYACAALGLVTLEYVGVRNAIHGNRVFDLIWPA